MSKSITPHIYNSWRCNETLRALPACGDDDLGHGAPRKSYRCRDKSTRAPSFSRDNCRGTARMDKFSNGQPQPPPLSPMKQQVTGHLNKPSYDPRKPPPLPAIIFMEKHRRGALSAGQNPHATKKSRLGLERGASKTSFPRWFDDHKDPEDAENDSEKYSHEVEPKKHSKTVDSDMSKTW